MMNWLRLSILQEKCVWHTLDDELVEIIFRKRASTRLSDMLRRARLGYEERGIRPSWMDENVFNEMLVYLKSDEFKKKSEKAKQRRASEKGAANHRVGSISITDHVDRMVVAKRRTPLMQELPRGLTGEEMERIATTVLEILK
ncbi:uncharacterized protein LOC131624218 [Vicia villosa]|uniref:uncharacterized protein LOC131624218 n=1 Tax=Vicia villosa TaxID=3911 RepID=UPI00273B190A|nr:uncharacterized protein LOC131624218 [Vicia villosa]